MATPELEHVFGYAGDAISCLGNGEYAYPCAVGILFGSIRTGKVTLWSSADGGRQVTNLIFNSKRTMFCYTERRAKVNLMVFSYPERKLIQRVPDIAKVEVADMAFSRDGTHFLVLAGAPTFAVSMYAVDPNSKPVFSLVQQPVQPPDMYQLKHVSFNPRSNTEFCTSGGGHILFWTLDKTGGSSILTNVEGRVGSPSVRLNSHRYLPSGEIMCGSMGGEVYTFDSTSGVGSLAINCGTHTPVVALNISRHHIVVCTEDGIVRFCAHDAQRTIQKTITLPTNFLEHFVFMPEWNTMMAGGRDGTLFIVQIPQYEATNLTQEEFTSTQHRMNPVADYSGSPLLGVVHLAKGSLVATVGNDSTLRVWDYVQNRLINKTHVGAAPLCMEVGKATARHLLLTGHENGLVRAFNVEDPLKPAVVLREKVHANDIKIVRCDTIGKRAIAIAAPDTIVFLETDPEVQIMGTVQLPDEPVIVDACWLGVPDTNMFLVAFSNAEMALMRTPDGPALPADDYMYDPTPLSINSWRLDYPVGKMTVASLFDDFIHLMVMSWDKELKLYLMDRTQVPSPEKDKVKPMVKPRASYRDHDKVGSGIIVPREKPWAVTVGADGRLCIRDVSPLLVQNPQVPKDLTKSGTAARHVPFSGGINGVALAPDMQRIFTAGADGILMVWSIGHPPSVDRPPFSIESQLGYTEEKEEDTLFYTKWSVEAARLQRIEHTAHRDEVKAKILALRSKMEELRAVNEKAEPDERVAPIDFLVDSQKKQLEALSAESVEAMKEDVRWKNLENDWCVDKIKRECWDVMEAKLTPVCGLLQQDLQVYNYHIRKTEKHNLVILKKLKFLRKVELLDRERRNIHEMENLYEEEEEPEGETSSTPQPPAEQEEPEEGEDDNGDKRKPKPLEEAAREDPTKFLYPTYHNYTRFRILTQIELLSARTTYLKTQFNEKFVELVERKKNDINRIEDRNTRARQVLKELDEQRELLSPKFQESEKPELHIQVKDEEVLADKSKDPDERRRLAQQQAEAERRLKAIGADDSSDKALKAWMDGRLEKEDRVLEVRVDLPEFAEENSEKYVPPEERTDDQNKAFKEYERKLAKKQEEVAARRKALQAEYAAIHKENVETAKAFDTAVLQTMFARVSITQKLHEVSLAKVKLLQMILVQLDRAKIVEKMKVQSTQLVEKLTRAATATKTFHEKVEAKKERLAQLQADEKGIERNMRSIPPFSDSDEHAEALIKMYLKRRPKKDKPRKEDRKGREKREAEVQSMDPFAFVEREKEIQLKAKQEAEAQVLLPRLERPEGFPDMLWEGFLNFRQKRADAEREIKRLTDEITEMTKEEHDLISTEENLRRAADESIRDIHRFNTDTIREAYDVDELRVFRQGVVEVDQAPVVTDYANAVLMHQSRVLDLNKRIRDSGMGKVQLLTDMKDFRKGIRMVGWEIEHNVYTAATLEMEHKHLILLRVTKQMQEYINGGGEDHNEKERLKLKKKIEHVKASMAGKIDEQNMAMLKIKRTTSERLMENNVLEGQVDEARLLVQDRSTIHHLQSSEQDKTRSARLMRDMRVTRKLEDVAKAQQEEMLALKKEIDRLRERTFPSFAVVSKRVVGNPDEL